MSQQPFYESPAPAVAPTFIERLRDLSMPVKLGLGALTATSVVLAGREALHLIHDHRHPEIRVGTEHGDVSQLATLLEGSKFSAYDDEGDTPETADTKLMTAVIAFQVDRGIDSKYVGSVREGDKTWDALEDSQADDTPEGLPAACYEDQDAICIVQDKAELSGDLYVMHDGKEKFHIENTGIGKPSDPSDDGEFVIDPSRMYEVGYFSQTYNHAPMPFAMFYNGGEAIHFSQLKARTGDDYPGSSGCITIGNVEQASDLFDYTKQVVNNGRSMNVVVSEAN